MRFNRRVFLILFSLFFLVSVINAGAIKRWWIYKEADVDKIYQNISQAGAKYQWDQEIITFQNEGMKMACTLVIPRTPYKPPIAITMNGFGENRHYKIIPDTGGEYFYERVSRILAEQGIATLRIDYRGSGDSDGTFDMTSFSSQIADALAAIDYTAKNLKNKVNVNRLGLVGFSQGGLVASISASRDSRVNSLAIWSAVASPPITYEYLLKREGMQAGIDLPEGGKVTIPIYIGDYYYGDFTLGKKFFKDLFSVDPLVAVGKYKGPLLYAAGLQDVIVWPQPYMGQMYMTYHDGFEKFVSFDTDHEFLSDFGPGEFDKVILWTAAWFLLTL